MKSIIALLFSALFVSQLYSQRDGSFFFNEFSASVNYTELKDNNTDNRFGFGVGAYRSTLSERMFNVVFGFEFNRTSQFKNGIVYGHFAYLTDVVINTSSISIPLLTRVNIGHKTKFFFEGGIFLDIVTSGLGRINFGPSYGVGVKIPMSKHELIIKWDYKYGLNYWDYGYEAITNRYVRLQLGYRI